MIKRLMLKISLYEHRITVKVILCLLLYVCVTPSFSQERVARGTADDGRVHLVHTDKLSFDQYKNPEAQILNGNVAFYHPSPILCTDNAAMIGAAAYYDYQAGIRSGLDLNAVPNLKLGER